MESDTPFGFSDVFVTGLSLRTRVLTGLCIIALVVAGVSVAITTTTRNHLIGQVDHRLEAALQPERNEQFGDFPSHPEGDDPRPLRPINDILERLSSMYEGLLLSDGTLATFFEPNVPGENFSIPDIDLATAGSGDWPRTLPSVDNDVDYRVSVQPAGGGFVVRAIPLNDVADTVNRMILVQALGFGVIAILLSIVGWWVIALGVRPIKEMTGAAKELAGGDVETRLPEPRSSGTESAELATALNGMLGRIQGAVDEQAKSEDRLRRFVADASHELRTPVTTIQGYAELYRFGGLPSGPSLDDAMRRTEQEAKRMGRLVEDMLQLAKLDQERPLVHEQVDVAQILRDAGADARVTAPERTITIDVDSDLLVSGDEDQIRQIVANILGNALVHTQSDAAIHIRSEASTDHVVVAISDGGQGMSAGEAERITERFYRADPSRSRVIGGSGLGMAITDSMIHAHNGTLTVQSSEGDGTTIEFRIPRTDR